MRALSKTPALDLPELAGLDQPSLFDTQPVPTGEPLMVPIDRLDQDPNNPRTEFPQQAIDELAQDIAQRGILQPIVVRAHEGGRYSIRFGNRRWRAARQAGLTEVPVVLATRAHDAYDQVAENLKRHGLSPLELARFIGGRAGAGDSNATIAKRLSIDETTVAHHLTLLALPPVLDIALQTGRCTSPRTLYELTKLHANQPERVTKLVTGSEPITRGAVAQIRDAALLDSSAMDPSTLTQPRSDRAAQFLANANRLCERLDAALLRLSRAGVVADSSDDVAALRQRVAALASRLSA